MSRQQRQPRTRPIRPRDQVTVDGGTTVYTVQAISQVGSDAYLTDGPNTSIGTWVALDQLALAAEEVAR